MQIDIKPSEPIKAKYGDKEFDVQKPKVALLRDFKRRVREAQKPDAAEGAEDIMWEFCLKVGVPQEILESWDLSEMTQFFGGIIEDGEKKSG